MPQKFIDRPMVAPIFLLGIFILITGIIFSWSFYSARSSQDTISVTGSAKQEIKADQARWTLQVYRIAFEGEIAGAYSGVARDIETVKNYLKQAGIPEEGITQNAVTADQDYSYQKTGNEPIRYRVHEEITVRSGDVDKVQSLAQDISSLISRGVSVSPQQPEYYVSTLPTLRIELLGKAIEDAKARVASIAKSGGASVGKLVGASSGVVQVLSPNSTNVEDYGSYDTSTIAKEVSVTARATFRVK